MASDLVKALWVGTPQAFVDGTPLVHGVTVQEIPAAEAEASDNWEPVTKAKAAKLDAATDKDAD